MYTMEVPLEASERWLSVEEIAAYLVILKRINLSLGLETGKIPASKVGKTVAFQSIRRGINGSEPDTPMNKIFQRTGKSNGEEKRQLQNSIEWIEKER